MRACVSQYACGPVHATESQDVAQNYTYIHFEKQMKCNVFFDEWESPHGMRVCVCQYQSVSFPECPVCEVCGCECDVHIGGVWG